MSNFSAQPPVVVTAPTTFAAPFQIVNNLEGDTVVLSAPATSAIAYFNAPANPFDGQEFALADAGNGGAGIAGQYPVYLNIAVGGDAFTSITHNAGMLRFKFSAALGMWIRRSVFHKALRARNTDGAVIHPRYRGFVPMFPSQYNGTGAAVGAVAETTLFQKIAMCDGHSPVFRFSNTINPATTTENYGTDNPITINVVFGPSATGAMRPAFFGGKDRICIQPGAFADTDPYGGISLKKGDNLYGKVWVRTQQRPAGATAVADTSAGTVPAGTYLCAISALHPEQGESNVTADITVTLSAAGQINLTALLPDLTLSTKPTEYGYYRTAAGGATGTKKLVCTFTVTGPVTKFTDDGSLALGTTSPKTTAQTYPVGYQTPGSLADGTNSFATGTGTVGADVTGIVTSAAYFNGYLGYYYGPDSVDLIPDGDPFHPYSNHQVVVGSILMDSIGWAQADASTPNRMGWAQEGMRAAGIACRVAFARPGAYAVASSTEASMAAAMERLCGTGFVNIGLGTNEMIAGTTAAATLDALMTLGFVAAKRTRPRVSTLAPLVYTTDAGASLAGQLRAGQQITALTAGTPGAITGTQYTNVNFSDGDRMDVVISSANTSMLASGTYYGKKTGAPNTNSYLLYTDAALTTPVTIAAGTFSTATKSGMSLLWRYNAIQAVNAAIRDGLPWNITTGVRAATGAVSAVGAVIVRAGQPGHPYWGVDDVMAGLEVDDTGTLAIGGGKWPLVSLSGGIYSINPTGNLAASQDGTHPAYGTAIIMYAYRDLLIAKGINRV